MVSKEQLIENINKDQKVQFRLQNIAKLTNINYEKIVDIFCERYNNPDVITDGSRSSALLTMMEYQAANKPEEHVEDHAKLNARDNDVDQGKLNRIDINGLPNYNYTRLFMLHMGMKNIHPEINYQNAICALSALALGHIRAKTKNMHGDFFKKPLKVNNFSVIVAGSGDGKTVSHDEMFDIISSVMGLDIFLEKKITPETMAKHLSSEQIERKLEKEVEVDDDGEPTGEKKLVLAEYHVDRSTDNGIHPGWKVYWHSEFGGTLANMAKPYMAGIKEDLCEYYSGSDGQKGNSGDKQGEITTFKITDPCVSINGATTTEGIKKLTTEDQANGLELRIDEMYVPFNVVFPDKTQVIAHPDIDPKNILSTLDRQRKESGLELENTKKRAMINASHIINILLHGQIIEAEFMDASYQYIINHEIAMRKHFSEDTNKTLLRSRHMENIYKHCILLAIGNLPYYVVNQNDFSDDTIDINGDFSDVDDLPELFKSLAEFDVSQLQNIRLSRLPIMPEIVRFVLKMYDRIYFPCKLAISELIGSTLNKTDVIKVREIMECAHKISKADVLTGLKYVAEMCEEAVDYYERKSYESSPTMSKNLKSFMDSSYIKDICAYRGHVEYEKLLDETRENIAMVDMMPDDVNITQMPHRDATRKSGLYDSQMKDVIRTLSGIRSIMSFPKSKVSVTHCYFPTCKDAALPDCEENHTDYKYSGPYPNQIELIHIAPVVVEERKVVKKEPKESKAKKPTRENVKLKPFDLDVLKGVAANIEADKSAMNIQTPKAMITASIE